MTDEVTEHLGNLVIPFGKKHKGDKIKDIDSDYLAWMAESMWDTDMHRFAFAARQELDRRKKSGEDKELATAASLEARADALLRAAGCTDLISKKGGRRTSRCR